MKILKKYWMLLLVIAMLLSMFSGCSNQTTISSDSNIIQKNNVPDKESTTSANDNNSYPLTTDDVSLTFFQVFQSRDAGNLTPSLNDNAAFKKATEITGVKIESVDVTMDAYQTKLNLMLASGSYTDLIFGLYTFYPTSIAGAIDEKIIIDLKPYIEKDAPNYNNMIIKQNFQKDVMTDDGSIGQFNSLEPNIYNPGYAGPFIRKDWLDKLNMSVPSTADDYYNVLKAFKTQLGASDAFFLGQNLSKQLNACYDLTYLGASMEGGLEYFQKDGKVTISALQDGYKDCVAMYRKWYEEGLIYKDFANANPWGSGNLMKEMFLNGKTGLFFGDANSDFLTWSKSATDPNFELTTFQNPVKTKGQLNHVSLQGLWPVDANGTAISTTCKNPELAMKYCDFWYTEQGIMLKSFGIEGESYNIVNGEPQYTDLVNNNPDGYTPIEVRYHYALGQQFGGTDPRKTTAAYTKEMMDWPAMWKSTSDETINYSRFVTLSNEESESISTKATDMATLLSEYVTAVIVGERPLSDIDVMIDTLKKLGINDVLAVEQNAYDRYMARGTK